MTRRLSDQLKAAFSVGLKQWRQTSLTARLAALLFLAFSLPLTYHFTYFSGYDGGGWLRTTTPLFVHNHWLLGFGAVYQENLVIHHENMPSVADISLLSGGEFAPNVFYSIRGLHPFLGTFLAPLLGAVKALVLLNYLYWALAAYAAWRFTLKLFNDERAALLAVLFVTGGIGWLTHLSDLSPHLSSYSFYFLGTLLLYESGVWRERRPLRTHLLLGVLLALALLNYQNGMVLLLFYVFVSLRYNRLFHVLAATLIGLSSTYLWAFQLSYLSRTQPSGFHHWHEFLGHTPHTLRTGFNFLKDNIQTPSVILTQYTHDFVQLLVALESLPLVILGLLSWWALRRNWALCWFFALGFLLQVGAVVPQSSWPSARGAYVYGASLFLVAPASYGLARMMQARSAAARWGGLALAVGVLGYHFYWGAAQFWGNTAPLSVYQATVLKDIVHAPQYSLLSTSKPVVLSLTGAEPTPHLYWGTASMVEAGALPVEAPTRWASRERALSRRQIILQSIIIRLPFLLYFTALLLLLAPAYNLRVLLPVWLIFWLGCAAVAALCNKVATSSFTQIIIPPGATARYSIQVSGAFLQELEKQLRRDAFLEGFTLSAPGGPCRFRLAIGGATVFEKESDAPLKHFPLPTTDELGNSFLARLKQHPELTVEYSNRGTKELTLYPWQRAGLPGRKLAATPPLAGQSARALPTFELRVRPRQPENKTVYLIGF